jgi:hypothetical protein
MKADAELLYECVSARARKAIGFGRVDGENAKDARTDAELREGDKADLVIFGSEKDSWRTRRSVSEAVYLYDHCQGRKAVFEGFVTT